MKPVLGIVGSALAVVAGWMGIRSASVPTPSNTTTVASVGQVRGLETNDHAAKGPKTVTNPVSLHGGEDEGVVKYLIPVTKESVKPGATYFRVEDGVLREVKGDQGPCYPQPCFYTLENECDPAPCRYKVVISAGNAIKSDDECPPACAFSVPQECPPNCATGLPYECPPTCMYTVVEAEE